MDWSFRNRTGGGGFLLPFFRDRAVPEGFAWDRYVPWEAGAGASASRSVRVAGSCSGLAFRAPLRGVERFAALRTSRLVRPVRRTVLQGLFPGVAWALRLGACPEVGGMSHTAGFGKGCGVSFLPLGRRAAAGPVLRCASGRAPVVGSGRNLGFFVRAMGVACFGQLHWSPEKPNGGGFRSRRDLGIAPCGRDVDGGSPSPALRAPSPAGGGTRGVTPVGWFGALLMACVLPLLPFGHPPPLGEGYGSLRRWGGLGRCRWLAFSLSCPSGTLPRGGRETGRYAGGGGWGAADGLRSPSPALRAPSPAGGGTRVVPLTRWGEAGGSVFVSFPSPSGGGCRPQAAGEGERRTRAGVGMRD